MAESLKNPGLSYLLLLHEPDRQGPEMYRALEEALQDGRTRVIGISNYDERWFAEFLNQCDIVPAVNRLECHIYFQKRQFQKTMKQEGTRMQAWAPLAQGIGDIAKHPTRKETGAGYGKRAAQIALKFLVQRGISVIPKSKQRERMKENMDIFDFNLTEEEMLKIKKLDRYDTFFPWTKAF